MNNRFVGIFLAWFFIDVYFFQSIKTLTAGIAPNMAWAIQTSYWAVELALAALLYYVIKNRHQTDTQGAHNKRYANIGMALVVLAVVPKLVTVPILFVEDIFRFGATASSWIGHQFSHDGQGTVFASRVPLVSAIALALSAIPFIGILYGISRGKYNYRVHKVTLEFDHLPDAFDGFKITQLSDVHAGSFDNAKAVKKGIALANAQHSDIIVFTGDMVNNVATEMEPWVDVFAELKAPMGKYSILGNHDYGDYVHWKSADAKAANLLKLEEIHAATGFKLLKNDGLMLEKGEEKIALLGVENWGQRGFAQYGDLQLAQSSVDPHSFKILLSHDPSHWHGEVIPGEHNIQLMLAGHTHGMQFGIEMFGWKWSPSKYIYPQWAGIYENNQQFLYVNRGFGFLGFPGRVGIMPEISVITLKKKRP
ncbi:hypothetical protein LX64_03422 [Chitinophaga skermanii]|uniref:Calcineurin-like phosphoesterase domain-containing protein n=1 Tax=Chitinophaga skermanii TaxID=331697 RepID=A0A327QCX2_9BACT|nr:metallophosphoesterase [Chitinophaga skermanii]RAJ02409.1 hypothetical protein LX64_03422 [Chitinophaga skermanii]